MSKSLNIQKSLFILAIPLLIITLMVFLAQSEFFTTNANRLSLAITIDVLLITPFIYFLLIRKTSIPKTTVVPFVILGVVACSFILPIENQNYLNLFKQWVLPFLELSIVSFIIYKIIDTRKRFEQNASSDFFTALKATCYEILPKMAVIPVVTEIAVIYYGFINWKRIQLKTNEFSYHKDSGTVGLLIALLFLIAIETVALHLLLSKWSVVAAWILTGLSIYSGVQILGFLKSMCKRPIVIQKAQLHLRYGIMSEAVINLNDIESVELSIKDIECNKTTKKLSFLGDLEGHNLIIKLNKENTLTGLYGLKKTFKVLALHVDKKQEFKNYIEELIKTEASTKS